jgi:hypothetical protein
MLIVAGCGRLDFNGLGVDAATGIDTATGDGMAGFGPWSPPRRLTELNSSSDDVNPSISADGLELYFASTRTTGNYRLHRATRATTDAVFDPPVFVSIANMSYEAEPALSHSGLEMYFFETAASVVESDRSAAGAPWGAPVAHPELSASSLRYPDFGDNDLRLVLTDASSMYLLEAARADTSSSWGTPRQLTEITMLGGNNRPALSNDGLELYFQNASTGGLYRTTRASVDAMFDTPQPFDTGVVGATVVADADISDDGTIFLFVADVGDGNLHDLYMLTRTRN